MIANLTTALTPVTIALGIVAVSFGICVLVGKGIKRADDEAVPSELPHWLADLDVTDDGADDGWRPDVQAAMRQALAQAALANDEPDPDFIARTRRVVVDELAQRRGAASS